MKKIIVLGVLVGFLGVVFSVGGFGAADAQTSSAKFSVGEKVKVVSNTLRVRREASLVAQVYEGFGLNRVDNVITSVYKNNEGTVVQGPTNNSGYVWWKINWGRYCPNGITSCTDLIGWSAQAETDGTLFLDKVVQPNTTTPPTSNPVPQGSFSLPAGGEIWQQGQTKLLSWNTPTTWAVNQVSLTLVDASGNHAASIAIVKNNVPINIQGGGDSAWMVPASIVSGSYKIKATVHRSDTTSPNVFLSNQFTIGVQGGGENTTSTPGTGGDTNVGDVKVTTTFTGCSTNAPATPMPTGNRAPSISYFSSPSESSIGTWMAGASDTDSNNVFFYQFNWGDGNYSCFGSNGVTGISGVTHNFLPGTYQVKLRVIDIYGAYTESVKTYIAGGTTTIDPPIIVQPPQPLAPVITNFSFKDAVMGSPSMPFYLVFNATDADSQLRSYSINWGDGSSVVPVAIDGTSITREVAHTYPLAGRYLVDLTVTDATNLTATRRTVILIGTQAACSTRFIIGDRVKVINGSPERGVNVRSTPSTINTALGTQANNSQGSVVGGPTLGSGLCWWQINYDAAPDGWTAEFDGVVNLLEKISSTPIVSPPPPTDTNTGDDTIYTDPGPIGVTTVRTVVAASNFVPGDYIRVVSLSGLRVRETPAGILRGVQSYWSSGKLTGQPEGANELTWWKIEFENYPSGWAAEKDETGAILFVKGLPPIPPPPIDDPVTPPPPPPPSVNNVVPVLDALTTPAQATKGVNTIWQVKATDANGDVLTYTVNWGDGSTPQVYSNKQSGVSVAVSHIFATEGNKTISVTVTDGQLTSTPQTLMVNVVAGASSIQGPSSEVSGPQTAVIGVATTWQIIAYDPDTASINFTVNWGDGVSESFSNPSGQPVMKSHTYGQSSLGQRTISVTATDGTSTHGSSWGINVATAEQATAKPSVPVITGPTQVTVGVAASWTVTLNDPDTNSLTYTLNWNDGTAIVNGTATRGVPFTITHTYATLFTGYKSIVINVSDGNGTEWGTKNLTSKLPNQAPTIGAVSGPTDVKAGIVKVWSVIATDPEGVALAYTFNWGDGKSNNYTNKASGVSFSADHIYTQSGNYTIQVTVADSGGLTAMSGPYSVRVNKFAVNDRVEVLSGNTLAVRATPDPNGTWIGGVKPLNQYGSKGTILEGPVVAGGYTWWRIAWDYTMTGWSAENWLVKTN